MEDFFNQKMEKGWVEKVLKAKNITLRGKEAYDQINILGDDGVPMEYHLRYWKSELVDFILLQQDAFDNIDCQTPLERQQYMLDLVLEICDKNFRFERFEKCISFFKNLINIMRQMNFSEYKSEQFYKYQQQLHNTVENVL